MMNLNFVRTALVALVCVLLAACTQSGISSYGGKIGGSVSTKEMRQKKIMASRERARKLKATKRASFFAKRKAAREARKNRRLGKTVKRSTRKKVKRVAKSRKKVARKKIAKKKIRRNRVAKRKTIKRKSKVALKKSRRAAKKRVAKVTKGRKLRVKKSRKAFVPRVAGKAGALRINAPWKCVPKKLKRVIYQIRKRWGPVTINSTHRSKRRNRMVGGKKRSWHLKCKAIDFRVHANTRGLRNWLKRHPSVGGYKRYRSGYYHIDTGPKRTW